MTDKPTWVQPGSPLFDGADAWEEYGNEIERLTRERDEALAQVAALREALSLHQAWADSEDAEPNYGLQNRDTHPDGERIWREWYDGNLSLCARAQDATRSALTDTAAAAEAVKRKWVNEGMKRATKICRDREPEHSLKQKRAYDSGDDRSGEWHHAKNVEAFDCAAAIRAAMVADDE